MSRPTPVEAVFGPLVEEWFPLIRSATEAAPGQGRDRDGFVLVKEVAEFLRELRPDDQAGAGLDELLAFVHAAFVHWLDGATVVELDRPALDRLLREAPAPAAARTPPPVHYVQLPSRRVWGEPLDGEPPEPLDGWFVLPRAADLECIAVFGLHPARPGLTVVCGGGPRPPGLRRADGTPPFAPRLAGGAEAGLHSVAGAEELVELMYRALAALGPTALRPGRQRIGA